MNRRPSCKINGFNYPASDKITSRISTLCRSMACTLMSRDACSPAQEAQWLSFFPNKTCAYCGKPATHLDHLFPMVDNSRPTGYATEPGNLVPCCKDCNTPKGNMHWEDFMRRGNCKHIGTVTNPSPSLAMQERIDIINNFQASMPAQRVVLDPALIAIWDNLLSNLDKALNDTEHELKILQSKLYTGSASKTSSHAKAPVKKTAPKKAYKSSGISEYEKLQIAADYLRNNISTVAMDKKYFGLGDSRGFKSWRILNELGISAAQKNLLKTSSIDKEILSASGKLKTTLTKIKTMGI